MKIDRHSDSVTELEQYLLEELKGITQSLNGEMHSYYTLNSVGRSSKKIIIEYDIDEKS